ncbi:hypothetical protein BGW37DRAFT_505385 [Umbelopsis sp. PMI_123]|nr:hypothetical protein BGW37DRAFT_505385 [Umbelopsis sp. PMI_123]
MPLPSFKELPIDPKYPAKSAWGLWGDDDSLGTMNLLTPERAKEASKLVRTGKLFPLNWTMENKYTMFNRGGFEHTIKELRPGIAFDDIYTNWNTQSSSQWDGLAHICSRHAPGVFYNNTPVDDIRSGNEKLGIHHLARKGIAGRGVLLDFRRWAVKHGIEYDPLTRYEISVEDLIKVAEEQGVTFQEGDILLVRSGFTEAYTNATDEIKASLADSVVACGVKSCDETLEWIWNHHFAAVAGDTTSFEAWPPTGMDTAMHSILLGGWGMPIGELFNLEPLAEEAAKTGVYEFLFTSAPLNKRGGVASPPNAICIM